MKTCPYCAEQIQDSAIKCRYCGSDLTEAQKQPAGPGPLFPKRAAKRAMIEKYESEGTVYCPKCLSTNLSANKKGFSGGKAVAGTLIAGPLGLLAGTIGSKKVEITCLNCGNKFKPGK